MLPVAEEPMGEIQELLVESFIPSPRERSAEVVVLRVDHRGPQLFIITHKIGSRRRSQLQEMTEMTLLGVVDLVGLGETLAPVFPQRLE